MTAVEHVLNLVVGENAEGKDVRVKDTLTEIDIYNAIFIFENQIKDAHEDGFHSGQSMAHNGKSKFESSKDYYNKTFKQQSK